MFHSKVFHKINSNVSFFVPQMVDGNSGLKPVFPNHLTQLSSTQQESAMPLREVTPAAAVTQLVSQVPAFTLQATPVVTVAKEDTSSFPVSSKTVTVSSNSVTTSSNNTTASNLTMQIPLIFPQGK